jgi:hypothetical protein
MVTTRQMWAVLLVLLVLVVLEPVVLELVAKAQQL